MSEEITTAQPRREGDNPFKPSTENTNSAGSQPGEQNGDGTPAPGGDTTNNRANDTKPFHEDPRWIEREDGWKKRFDTQEQRHQEDLRKIREEFGQKREDNASQNKMPSWFGGDQKQWDDYRADRDAELKLAQETAIKRFQSEREESDKSQQKLQQEATEYMQAEFAAIESDKKLNPAGSKIDADKFLKYVVDNKFVDYETQKWDYRRAWKYFQLENTPPKAPDNKERKNLAVATTSESRGETKPAPFKTNKDFNRRKPW